MKKIFALALAVVLASCGGDDGDALLCVANDCPPGSGKYVMSVFVDKWGVDESLLQSSGGILSHSNSRDPATTDSGFYLVYLGEIAPQESRSISLDPGEYSVGVLTKTMVAGEWHPDPDMKDTGHKNYRTIESGMTVTARYDGNGVYFERSE